MQPCYIGKACSKRLSQSESCHAVHDTALADLILEHLNTAMSKRDSLQKNALSLGDQPEHYYTQYGNSHSHSKKVSAAVQVNLLKLYAIRQRTDERHRVPTPSLPLRTSRCPSWRAWKLKIAAPGGEMTKLSSAMDSLT